jgi:hypothetical protein
MWLRDSRREARSSWAAGSVFGRQEPVHEGAHQLAASMISHTEIQAGGHDLPAGIQSPNGLMGLMVQDLARGVVTRLIVPAETDGDANSSL